MKNRPTTAPPFLAVDDIVVIMPAQSALHVGGIAGGHVGLWEKDQGSE